MATPSHLLSCLLSLLLGSQACLASIRVGEYASLTGKEAAFGQSSHRGTVLAIEELNAGGGLLGEKVELITEDNQSKPGESVTAVKKLIARDKVCAVLGEVASGRSLEGASVCQAFKIPMVSPFSTNPKVTELGDYIFRVCFTDPFQGSLLARFSHERLKARKAAILTSVSAAYSVGLTKYYTEAFTSLGGTVVADQKYGEGDKDFAAQLTAIKAAAPDVLVVTGYYTEAALICRQARQLGLGIPILGGDGCDAPELIAIGGADVEGFHVSTHFSAEDKSPRAVAFIEAYTRRHGEAPDASAALGYDSAMVLADAIRRAGKAEPKLIRAALAATKDYPSVTGLITIDEKRNARKPAVILAVRNGALHFVESVAP
jgi:branched-chain amino acid transport system substrate-binding protein